MKDKPFLYFPFDRFNVETQLTLQEMKDKLTNLVHSTDNSNKNTDEMLVSCRVEWPRFELLSISVKGWKYGLLSVFRPNVKGEISEGANGSKISITMQWRLLTLLIMAVICFIFAFGQNLFNHVLNLITLLTLYATILAVFNLDRFWVKRFMNIWLNKDDLV